MNRTLQVDSIGLCHRRHSRLWDFTEESQVPGLKSLKSPPFFLGKNPGHLRMRSHIFLIFQCKTTEILSLFSRLKQNATRLQFSRKACTVEISIFPFTKILKLSFSLYQQLLRYYKANMFSERSSGN